mmetsp:Transcript_52475/g.122031  ORF Transcript_52475/g.122031 Transcript_52475/m.122031 type:complete len:278 (-) Transcript_52475:94-927(-)
MKNICLVALNTVLLHLLFASGSRVTTRGLVDLGTDGSTESQGIDLHAHAALANARTAGTGGEHNFTFHAAEHVDAPVSGAEVASHLHARTAQQLQAHSAGTTPLAETLKTDRATVLKLIQESGELTENNCWILDGDRMGCEADCQCRWLEQCYPKFVSMMQPSPKQTQHPLANVGICGIAMPVLIFLSGVLFVTLLSCVVSVRMYFQWRETQVVNEGCEGTERPKSLLLPSATGSLFPPAPQVPDSPDAHGEHQTGPWPEAEDVTTPPVRGNFRPPG